MHTLRKACPRCIRAVGRHFQSIHCPTLIRAFNHVVSSCKSAIFNRWMRTSVDRPPLNYVLDQMRSAAGRVSASKARLRPLA